MSYECYMNVTFRFCFRSPLKSLKLPVFKGLSTDLGSHSFLHISFYPLYDLPVPKVGERYITSIGRPSYQKNPLFMVEVAHGIHLKHPDIKFYLLGVGFYSPMLEDMKKLIHQYDMDDTFYLLPWLSHEETLKYVKGSILYFMTSLYEGLPISVIEAMSLGKAIVASDVLGNKDCVKDGYNGYLLPLKEEVFVEKMNDLIENDEKRKEMEKNSRSYFESDFFIDNRIKALEDLYTEVYNR